jgi:hypothetical protein
MTRTASATTRAARVSATRQYTDRLSLLQANADLVDYVRQVRLRCAVLEVRLQNKTEDIAWMKDDNRLLRCLDDMTQQILKLQEHQRRIVDTNVAYQGIERKLQAAQEQLETDRAVSRALLADARKEIQRAADRENQLRSNVAAAQREIERLTAAQPVTAGG